MTIAFNKLFVPLLGLAFGILTFLAFYFNFLPLIGLPFGVAIGIYTFINFRNVFFLLLFCLPLSTEVYFSSTLGTDIPDEPLMILLTGAFFLYWFTKPTSVPVSFLFKPLTVLLLLHLGWILATTIWSVDFLVSFKIFLAKVWYVVPFYFVSFLSIKKESDFKLLFWCIFIPATITILQTMARHGLLYAFSFEDINKCTEPFYRNHVNYAAMVSMIFPMLLWVIGLYGKGTFTRKMLYFFVFLYIAAIWFSFTRTCMLALLLIPFVIMMIKWKLTRYAVLVVLLGGSYFLYDLIHDNNYLKLAPEYNTTVYHDEFSDHMSSTFEGKDVSSMERIYRWIGASRMFANRPLTGFGVGNFYPYYKQYTVSSFETWISDNEERSTVHNYFLLLLCEQGIFGFIIFVLLTIGVFILGEKYYHRAETANQKRFILYMIVGMAVVFVNILLSDMLESDKVGPFFFIYLSMLVSASSGFILFKENSEQR